MTWWMKNNLRMIQNNLRDEDAKIDVDRHMEWLKSFGINVLQIGCGGITAFHPTKLACQYESPYMKGDFLGEIVEKCHANGIKVIARFDFSKTHESFFVDHPSWYARRGDGTEIRYNDTVATCVNGDYQRQLSLEAIREVLENYPVDGIFFNMFGYVTSDYSGNHIGICRCDNCKRRFFEMYGDELPAKEDENDPIYLKYLQFKERTVNEILINIYNLTKSISKEIAVSSYTPFATDIVRNESNSALGRPLPFWLYNSSDNVSKIEGSYEDKISSNCAINAVDLPYRFMGVSKYLNQIRLYENIASGSGLDWCIIGNFDEYPDHENMDTVREVFNFHKRYEKYYGHFLPGAKVMVVYESHKSAVNKEYRGIFKMLKEAHIPFSAVYLEELEKKINTFDQYEVIILPAVISLSESVKDGLKKTKACVVGSGLTAIEDTKCLEQLFGIRKKRGVQDVRGTYLLTEPKKIFADFNLKQWVFLDKEYADLELLPNTEGMLPKVEKSMFGPPERCYGHQVTEESMVTKSAGGNIYFPWSPGELYYQHGYDEFKRLLLDVVDFSGAKTFETNAPEMVEMFLDSCDASTYMLQMINLTGFNGTSFFEPLAVSDIFVKLTHIEVASVYEMTEDGLEEVGYDGELKFSMNKGKIYKAFLIKTKEKQEV